MRSWRELEIKTKEVILIRKVSCPKLVFFNILWGSLQEINYCSPQHSSQFLHQTKKAAKHPPYLYSLHIWFMTYFPKFFCLC